MSSVEWTLGPELAIARLWTLVESTKTKLDTRDRQALAYMLRQWDVFVAMQTTEPTIIEGD